MHAVRAMVLFSYIYLIIIFKRLICIWVRLRGCDWSEQQPRAHFYFPLLALRDSRVLRTFQKYHVIPLFFIFSFEFFYLFSFPLLALRDIIRVLRTFQNITWLFILYIFLWFFFLFFFLLRRNKNDTGWLKLPLVPFLTIFFPLEFFLYLFISFYYGGLNSRSTTVQRDGSCPRFLLRRVGDSASVFRCARGKGCAWGSDICQIYSSIKLLYGCEYCCFHSLCWYYSC